MFWLMTHIALSACKTRNKGHILSCLDNSIGIVDHHFFLLKTILVEPRKQSMMMITHSHWPCWYWPRWSFWLFITMIIPIILWYLTVSRSLPIVNGSPAISEREDWRCPTPHVVGRSRRWSCWWWWWGGRWWWCIAMSDLTFVDAFHAAGLAIKLAEGGPKAGFPPHKLDRPCWLSWWRWRGRGSSRLGQNPKFTQKKVWTAPLNFFNFSPFSIEIKWIFQHHSPCLQPKPSSSCPSWSSQNGKGEIFWTCFNLLCQYLRSSGPSAVASSIRKW